MQASLEMFCVVRRQERERRMGGKEGGRKDREATFGGRRC